MQIKQNKNTLLLSTLIVPLMFTLAFPLSSYAASPALGAASTYGILSSTYSDTSAATTVNGDVGFTTPPASAIAGTHANFGSAAPYATAGIDQGNTLSALASEPCSFTFAPGPIDLSTDTTHGPIGVYAPGVYCSVGAMDVGGPISLSGSGTFIFRPVGALTSTAGAAVTLAGGSACDVFWTPSAATTLAANTTFVGNIIDDSGVTIGANTTLTGSALSFGGTVTTDTDIINPQACSAPIVIAPVVAEVVVVHPSEHRNPIAIAPVVAPAIPEVLGAFTQPVFVPTLPNTGAGGESAGNYAILLSSLAIVVFGILRFRTSK